MVAGPPPGAAMNLLETCQSLRKPTAKRDARSAFTHAQKPDYCQAFNAGKSITELASEFKVTPRTILEHSENASQIGHALRTEGFEEYSQIDPAWTRESDGGFLENWSGIISSRCLML